MEEMRYMGLAALKLDGMSVAFDEGAEPPASAEQPAPKESPASLDIEPGYYWVYVDVDYRDDDGGDVAEEIGEYTLTGGYGGVPAWLMTGNDCPFSLNEVTLLSPNRIVR